MAQTALFITTKDLKRNSIIDGNVDVNVFIQYVKIAQELHIRNFTGSQLYEVLSNAIINNSLSYRQKVLLEDYIQPMLIHYALVEYYPFANYQIKNGGIFKHNSETATSADKSEVDYLIAKSRGIAEYYTRRFIDYMQYNQDKFPSYNQQKDDDIYPDKDSLFNGWVL